MSPLILSLNTDKKCSNYIFKIFGNMFNIIIKVIAYGCRPENGRICLIVQWCIL